MFEEAAGQVRERVPVDRGQQFEIFAPIASPTFGVVAGAGGGQVLAKDVGAAVGRNPLSVVVPCHRVVGKDGRLTGYAGGLARKRFLLDLEEAASRRPARLF